MSFHPEIDILEPLLPPAKSYSALRQKSLPERAVDIESCPAKFHAVAFECIASIRAIVCHSFPKRCPDSMTPQSSWIRPPIFTLKAPSLRSTCDAVVPLHGVVCFSFSFSLLRPSSSDPSYSWPVTIPLCFRILRISSVVPVSSACAVQRETIRPV